MGKSSARRVIRAGMLPGVKWPLYVGLGCLFHERAFQRAGGAGRLQSCSCSASRWRVFWLTALGQTAGYPGVGSPCGNCGQWLESPRRFDGVGVICWIYLSVFSRGVLAEHRSLYGGQLGFEIATDRLSDSSCLISLRLLRWPLYGIAGSTGMWRKLPDWRPANGLL